MTKEQVALKLALEALEGQCRLVSQTRHRLVGPAITAIKEVLNSCQCPECKVVLHASDCAVHNEPAYPKGQCNCGAQPEQEPVAWMFQHEETGRMMFVEAQQLEWGFEKCNPRLKKIRPVYTTPPQRKPLTDAEIDELRSGYQSGRIGSFVALARAIEAAHGIKELKEAAK